MQKNKFARKKIAELMVDIREEWIFKFVRKNDKNLYFKIFGSFLEIFLPFLDCFVGRV